MRVDHSMFRKPDVRGYVAASVDHAQRQAGGTKPKVPAEAFELMLRLGDPHWHPDANELAEAEAAVSAPLRGRQGQLFKGRP